MGLHTFSTVVLFSLLMGNLWVVVPASYSCAVQMNSVTYPSSANTKQSFQIVAEVTATCTSQLTEIASVRVDVVDAASTIAIASGLFMPGYAFTADWVVGQRMALSSILLVPR